MPDQRLRYTIEADDSKAAEAHKRQITALQRIEATATQAGKTVASAFDAMTKAMVASADSAHALRNTVAEFTALAVSVGLAAKATGAYALAHENLLNTYRAGRLLLSPTIFTATSVAIGVVVTETLRLANARAKLIEQDFRG